MAGAGGTLTRESLIIVAFSILIFLYSFFTGQLLWGLIVIFLVVILSRFIHAGANNPMNNPLSWVLLIIILSYFFIIGLFLWGLITVLLIAILWGLIYRTSKKVEEKHYEYSKRPTGITILAALYAYTVIVGIFGLITGQPAIFFGVTLSGVPAQMVHVISILIGIYLTYGFIKLFKLARIIAIIFGIYGLLNILINVVSYIPDMPFGLIGPMFRLLFNLIILVYIIGKADYFIN